MIIFSSRYVIGQQITESKNLFLKQSGRNLNKYIPVADQILEMQKRSAVEDFTLDRTVL